MKIMPFFIRLLFIGTIGIISIIPVSAQLFLPVMAGVVSKKPIPVSVTTDLMVHLDAANSTSYPGSGTSWIDLSTNSINGDLYDGNSVGIGPLFSSQDQGSLIFDGINDYVNFSNGFSTTDNITYEAWVNPSILDGNFRVILNHDGWASGYIHFQFINNSLQFALNGENDQYSTYSFNTNTWYQVAAVYSRPSKTISFYVNGVLTNTENYGNPPSVTNTVFKMGSWNGNDRFFAGKIGLVRIYNRALSSAEIQTNFSSSKSRFGL
jgi:Concanavalin A-like lectin/glucanases superfamily